MADDFKTKSTTLKGTYAERLVLEFLDRQRVQVYTPHPHWQEKPHGIDGFGLHRSKLKLFGFDIKAKARRTHYPDTGIDLRHYGSYKFIEQHNGIQVYLFFVDEYIKKMYGNWLSVLEHERCVQHQDELLAYPRRERNIIYFPLEAMVDICKISDESAGALQLASTRRYAYEDLTTRIETLAFEW